MTSSKVVLFRLSHSNPTGHNRTPDPLLRDILRVLAPYTNARIAQKSGLSPTTIQNWRTGKTTRPQLSSVSVALRVAGMKLTITADR